MVVGCSAVASSTDGRADAISQEEFLGYLSRKGYHVHVRRLYVPRESEFMGACMISGQILVLACGNFSSSTQPNSTCKFMGLSRIAIVWNN
jgi:hypothetical protein